MQRKISLKIEDYEAFIFDMDGLLLDTERICWECFQKACGKFGLNADFNIYKLCLGRKADEGNKLLAEGFKSCSDFNSINKEWGFLYRDHIDNKIIPLKKGVLQFLDLLKTKNIPLGLATSTERVIAIKKLSKTELSGYFSVIVTGDDVKNSKPDPEIYLKAAALLKVKPEHCIAFEDSDNGVRSSFSAGMKVVQIPDLLEPSVEVRAFGHSIISSFEDIILK